MESWQPVETKWETILIAGLEVFYTHPARFSWKRNGTWVQFLSSSKHHHHFATCKLVMEALQLPSSILLFFGAVLASVKQAMWQPETFWGEAGVIAISKADLKGVFCSKEPWTWWLELEAEGQRAERISLRSSQYRTSYVSHWSQEYTHTHCEPRGGSKAWACAIHIHFVDFIATPHFFSKVTQSSFSFSSFILLTALLGMWGAQAHPAKFHGKVGIQTGLSHILVGCYL